MMTMGVVVCAKFKKDGTALMSQMLCLFVCQECSQPSAGME